MRKLLIVYKKNLEEISAKKVFDSYTDTEIGPWFLFPIPKPGSFVHYHEYKSTFCMKVHSCNKLLAFNLARIGNHYQDEGHHCTQNIALQCTVRWR